jgi:hypothetical protein
VRIDSTLRREIDAYAEAHGITRSRAVVEMRQADCRFDLVVVGSPTGSPGQWDVS